jgi:signal transduction histidine kinase
MFSDYMIQQAMVYGSLSAVLLMFGLSVWVAVEGRGSQRHTAFSGVIMMVAFWLLCFAFWRIPSAAGQDVFWFRSLFFIGSMIPAFYYLFSLTYLMSGRIPKVVWVLTFLPNVAILWLVYGTNYLISTSRFGTPIISGGRALFALHFSLFVIASLAVLLYTSRVRKHIDPKELFPVIAGAIIAFYSVFGVLFSSTMAQDVNYLLTLVSLIGGVVIIVPFIIKRRLLVDLRLVGVEVLIFIALFIFIADIVVSAETLFDFTFRLSVLVLLIFYGIMTTKVLFREIKQLQKAEVMQEQIIRMNGRLIEADRLKTKFVSLVAHQLSSPLTSIHIYLNMCSQGEFGKVPPKMKEVLGSNMEALERLIKTTQTFLDVAKIELGKIELYKTDTNMSTLVDRLIKEVNPLAVKKGLTLRSYIAPGMPLVNCDSGAIYHVLMNFVDNAIKYTERGEVIVTVSLDENEAEVRVTDTGMGLTEEDKKSLFRVFERGMSAVKLQSRGEGLGIFIARQFIDAHDGKVIVESEGRDKGSTFGFRIPLNG